MISVIIPTYNEEKNIERCLKAFEKQTITREAFEIIIVDGQSSDRTTTIAKNFADRVIQQVSKGVGGARNDGVQIAKGDIIVTTDADCIPYAEWLQVIQNQFKDEKVVAVTGFLNPFDCEGLRKYEAFIYKLLFGISNQLLRVFSITGYYHLCGANSAFDRDTFLEIGGYQDLPYSDDIEIYKRLKPRGKMVLDTRMKVNYSIRRIRKMSLLRYIYTITKNDFVTMVMNAKPKDDSYARQAYS
ncbi:glycosyl transferase [Candidatus Bathyarchaeota archaeon]|jgi:glycosyltransferase involved in cell wall biosynthesis|nr:glycosyl transferase [Candidatus Bathyarchaeota archaeon]MDP6048787.1 glycosyltransferase [Candidatus Bathyarchaeota archaeon]|tara:strand:+ start:8524 stop:9252 length:729 start_codon:yes stop_codon:yes gene_type:complete